MLHLLWECQSSNMGLDCFRGGRSCSAATPDMTGRASVQDDVLREVPLGKGPSPGSPQIDRPRCLLGVHLRASLRATVKGRGAESRLCLGLMKNGATPASSLNPTTRRLGLVGYTRPENGQPMPDRRASMPMKPRPEPTCPRRGGTTSSCSAAALATLYSAIR